MRIRYSVRFKNKLTLFVVFFLIFFLQYNCGEEKSRPHYWATAVEREGLPNLYKVSDNLYRGAQPGKKGFEELKKLGIKTIVNFRNSEKDWKHIKGMGFNYYHLPVNTLFPKREKFERFLEIAAKPENWPVFVHCKRGADRTGTAAALYRVKIQNWDKEKAIDEMVNGGYHFNKIYIQLKRFIREF